MARPAGSWWGVQGSLPLQFRGLRTHRCHLVLGMEGWVYKPTQVMGLLETSWALRWRGGKQIFVYGEKRGWGLLRGVGWHSSQHLAACATPGDGEIPVASITFINLSSFLLIL